MTPTRLRRGGGDAIGEDGASSWAFSAVFFFNPFVKELSDPRIEVLCAFGDSFSLPGSSSSSSTTSTAFPFPERLGRGAGGFLEAASTREQRLCPS